MEQAPARFFETITTNTLAPLLSISHSDFYTGLEPRIVSTGMRDLLVPVKDNFILNGLKPNLDGIAKVSEAHAISGFHVFCLGDKREPVIARARNFSPFDGIPEEAATGTSNGALLSYLKYHDLLADRSEPYCIEQGKSMGCLSRIYGYFKNDTVWVGGFASEAVTASL
jgi:PhzF family phenazine biosynthesis protein